MDITQDAQRLASDLKESKCYARTIEHDMVAFFDPATQKQRDSSYDLSALLRAFELGLVERRNIMTTGRAHSEVIEVYAPIPLSL
jgi:hypothetical protein